MQDLDDIRNHLSTNFTLLRSLDFDDDDSYDHSDPDWETKKALWTTGGWISIGKESEDAFSFYCYIVWCWI